MLNLEALDNIFKFTLNNISEQMLLEATSQEEDQIQVYLSLFIQSQLKYKVRDHVFSRNGKGERI